MYYKRLERGDKMKKVRAEAKPQALTVVSGVEMSISGFPVDTRARLTEGVKKVLCDLITKEFNNKESLFHHIVEQEKDTILKKYQGEVGYPDAIRQIQLARNKIVELEGDISTIKKKLLEVGLTETGQPHSTEEYDKTTGRYRTVCSAVKLDRLLRTVEANAPSQTLKSKLIARMQLATTLGEANAIMRDVLGNGVLPKSDPFPPERV